MTKKTFILIIPLTLAISTLLCMFFNEYTMIMTYNNWLVHINKTFYANAFHLLTNGHKVIIDVFNYVSAFNWIMLVSAGIIFVLSIAFVFIKKIDEQKYVLISTVIILILSLVHLINGIICAEQINKENYCTGYTSTFWMLIINSIITLISFGIHKQITNKKRRINK